MNDSVIQTRGYDDDIRTWDTIAEAFEYAEGNSDVWKVSFPDVSGDRVRLVREGSSTAWTYEPIMRAVNAVHIDEDDEPF